MPYRPKDVRKALEKLGFVAVRQTGSHCTLKHPNGRRTVVPMHNKDMRTGLFKSILDDVGLTEAQLKEVL